MPPSKERYRLYVELSQEHHEFLVALPHGYRTELIKMLLNELIDECYKMPDPNKFISDIVTGGVDLGAVLGSLQTAKDNQR